MTHETFRKKDVTPASLAPGPKGYPMVGIIPKIGDDLLGYFVKMMLTYGAVVRLDLGTKSFYLVTHPKGIRRILQDNNRNYIKGYDQAKPLIGEGLVSSEGEFWRRQRRLMQPAFHRSRTAGFAEVMVETATEVMNQWHTFATRGEPLDISKEMIRITQQVIARTMFSTDVGEKTDMLLQAFDVGLEYLNQRMFNPIPFLDRLPTPTNLRFRRALATLDELIYALIEERRRSDRVPDDLLSMLLEAKDDESGQGMSDRQLRDELVTVFFAGHETTASTLSWSAFLLAKHPEDSRRVRAEVDAVLQGRRPTIEDYPKLVYTRRVIDESLRIYPPAWMFARQAIDEDEICGIHIPAGASILLSPYATHRHPEFWVGPENFDPDRFSPDRSLSRPRMAYFPFGGGPRLCIGREFALVEATLILAVMMQSYTMRLLPDYDVKAQPIATLRPRPGVCMLLESRSRFNGR